MKRTTSKHHFKISLTTPPYNFSYNNIKYCETSFTTHMPHTLNMKTITAKQIATTVAIAEKVEVSYTFSNHYSKLVTIHFGDPEAFLLGKRRRDKLKKIVSLEAFNFSPIIIVSLSPRFVSSFTGNTDHRFRKMWLIIQICCCTL